MTLRPTLAAAVLAAFSLCGGGCYTASPKLWETSNDTFAYDSTSMRPVTITLIDTRTDEPFFRMEVPVGKRLAFHFDETGGDDPVRRPAKLTWGLIEPSSLGGGSLTNSQSAPPLAARRIEYAIRTSPEFPPDAPEAAMRVNGDTSKPEWATEQGGPAPLPNSKKLYE